VIGSALVLAGVALMFIPGPGIPLLALGAALTAQQSARVARALDAFELWLRKVLRRSRSLWVGFPSWAKVLVAIAAIMIVGALSAGAYQLTLGR
jgi:hypothetical protein